MISFFGLRKKIDKNTRTRDPGQLKARFFAEMRIMIIQTWWLNSKSGGGQVVSRDEIERKKTRKKVTQAK